MAYWSPSIESLTPLLERAKRNLNLAPLSIRLYAVITVGAVLVYAAIGRAPSSSLVSTSLRVVIVIAVVNRSVTGWGLGIMIGVGSVVLGLSGENGQLLLFAYPIVALPLLLAPSAREWCGVNRRREESAQGRGY
jgi:hypothetical protein